MDYDPEEEPVDREKGIDWNLHNCLQANPQPGFKLKDIEKVLAVVEGEHDGPYWHWIIELTNGKFVYLRGSCDFTGWDCRSEAESTLTDDVADACMAARRPEEESTIPVTLWSQVQAGREKTKHEIVGEKMQKGED